MSFSSPLQWYWVVAPVAVAVLAVMILVLALFHVARGRFFRGSLHAGGGAVLALAAFGAGLMVLETQSYARLTAERPVAEVTVAAIHPALQTWRVTVRRLDGVGKTDVCQIQGDEWEMSAAVQTWQTWMEILGLDSTYTLDQLANKYFNAARGNGRRITACDLTEAPPAFIPHGLSAWLTDQMQLRRRRFGSAVYMPLTDGAIYRVVMTEAGLNAQPLNPIAEEAVKRRV